LRCWAVDDRLRLMTCSEVAGRERRLTQGAAYDLTRVGRRRELEEPSSPPCAGVSSYSRRLDRRGVERCSGTTSCMPLSGSKGVRRERGKWRTGSQNASRRSCPRYRSDRLANRGEIPRLKPRHQSPKARGGTAKRARREVESLTVRPDGKTSLREFDLAPLCVKHPRRVDARKRETLAGIEGSTRDDDHFRDASDENSYVQRSIR